jgi:hypothetical protein
MSACQYACYGLVVTVMLAGHAHTAERSVYRCVADGVVTFSDRPCGSLMQVYSYEIASPAAAEAPAAAKAPASAKPAQVRKPGQQRAQTRSSGREVGCERIQARLEQLRARMRAGYGVAEGERLRDQERTARARFRKLLCR